jgi:hypothetical protein
MNGRLYYVGVACREIAEKDKECVPCGVDVKILASYCHENNCAVHPLVVLVESGSDDDDDKEENKDDNCSDIACSIEREHFEHYLKAKFKSLDTTSMIHHTNNATYYYESSLGNWHVKEYDGYIYVVVTSVDYELIIAAEGLDALSDSILHQRKKDARTLRNYFRKNTGEAQALCCQQVAEAYQDFEDPGIPHTLMTKMDPEEVMKYSQAAKKLQVRYQEITAVKNQMHDNIQQVLENTAKMEDLKDLSDELLEGALVFKKNAKKLHNHFWKAKLAGAGLAAMVGGGVGLMAGGPAGAVLFTEMASVAGAQAIEMAIGAAVFGGLYLGADSVGSWAFSQPLRFLPPLANDRLKPYRPRKAQR